MGGRASVPTMCDDELFIPCNSRTWICVDDGDSPRGKKGRSRRRSRDHTARHSRGALHPSSDMRTLVPTRPPGYGYVSKPYSPPFVHNTKEAGTHAPILPANEGGGGPMSDCVQDGYGNWYLKVPVHDFAFHDAAYCSPQVAASASTCRDPVHCSPHVATRANACRDPAYCFPQVASSANACRDPAHCYPQVAPSANACHDSAYCYSQQKGTLKPDTNAGPSARSERSMATTASSLQQQQPTNAYSDPGHATELSHIHGEKPQRNEAVSQKLSTVSSAFHASTTSRIYDDERSEPKVRFSSNVVAREDGATVRSGQTKRSTCSGHPSRTTAHSEGVFSGSEPYVQARQTCSDRSHVAGEQGGEECGEGACTRSLVDIEIGRFSLNEKLCAKCDTRCGTEMQQKDQSFSNCAKALQYFETEVAEMRRLPSTFHGTTFHSVEFSTGAVYAGWWSYRQRHGYGLHTWRDGSYYVGKWTHNCVEGLGMFARSCGASYIGQWVANQATGLGHSKPSEDAEYCGVWEANELHGLGIEVSKKGHHYYGQFSRGVKDGVGRCMWDDGSYFDGEWRNNTISGFGTHVTSDGRTFRGEWKNSKMHGLGVYAWSDGRSYRGEYRNDVKHGFGILEFPDGRSYEGSWDNGMQHGKGRVTTAEGRRYTAIWSYGTRVRIIEDSERPYN